MPPPRRTLAYPLLTTTHSTRKLLRSKLRKTSHDTPTETNYATTLAKVTGGPRRVVAGPLRVTRRKPRDELGTDADDHNNPHDDEVDAPRQLRNNATTLHDNYVTTFTTTTQQRTTLSALRRLPPRTTPPTNQLTLPTHSASFSSFFSCRLFASANVHALLPDKGGAASQVNGFFSLSFSSSSQRRCRCRSRFRPSPAVAVPPPVDLSCKVNVFVFANACVNVFCECELI